MRPYARARARRGQRGATIVEYALILAVFVIGLIGGLRGLEASAGEDLSNEFDCVSERPPPAACQKRAVTTTTTTTVEATTSTSTPAETTTTTSSTTTAPTSTTSSTSSTSVPTAATSVDWSSVGSGSWDGRPYLYGSFYLRRDGNLEAGRLVSWVVRDLGGNDVMSGSCTTGSGGWFQPPLGACSVLTWVPRDAGDLQVVITSIGGTPSMELPAEGSPWLSID